ncbi:MAG: hypothetical protein KUG77_15230 [Nannocystaceae bacterium]|nr:hypothetical protein [Nannocystaceae bacterium]
MAQAVKYKKPRKLNSVSIVLLLLATLSVYLGYQYLPLYLQKQEAYRVLEETGSAFSGRRAFYIKKPKALETLRRGMESDLRRVGVDDPDLETWIERDDKEMAFGAIYSIFIEWPFGAIPKQEFVYEVEHVVNF